LLALLLLLVLAKSISTKATLSARRILRFTLTLDKGQGDLGGCTPKGGALMARAQLFVISCELCGVSWEWMLFPPVLVDYRFVYV